MHSFTLNEHALSEVLLHPSVADKSVSIVSVAGAFRRGKSFMLNFFLKYLRNEVLLGVEWLNDDASSLEGFSWRGGAERDTSGVLLWSQPFVLLITFRSFIIVLKGRCPLNSERLCLRFLVFLRRYIYNLSQNIQEDDLQHLQLFTEYGRLALEDNVKPFQVSFLNSLVKNLTAPLIEELSISRTRLELSLRTQHPELQQLRQHISTCFTDISCFLMPHPGLKVATSPNFHGQLSDIEVEFKRQLMNFVPQILAPNNLVIKKINGREICCRELLEYFRSYMKVFAGEDLPEPKSMLLATAEANNLAAVANARALYCNEMEEVCGGDTPYLAPEELEGQHMEKRSKSIRMFKNVRKMGGEEYSLSFLNTLEAELNACFENYVKLNNGKNMFRSFRTPAVFFLMIVLNYFFQEMFVLLRLDLLASLCSSLLGLFLITLALWTYVRYTGDMREFGQTIDTKHASVYVSSNLTANESTNSLGNGRNTRQRRKCRK
ncbi:atlastin [Trichuris trichiura]|uniref:Atlastin n=1 Tax=Trichuris trichiura TaxID=36087 RepID=A0A077Z841_TRITR|nr:atlastin [Trichuris trichiura]